jgi:hypothetical protein
LTDRQPIQWQEISILSNCFGMAHLTKFTKGKKNGFS